MMSIDRRKLQLWNGGLSPLCNPFSGSGCDLNMGRPSHNWMIKESADNCLLATIFLPPLSYRARLGNLLVEISL